MAEKAVGFIETFGLTAAIAAADAAVKTANVKLLGYEYAKGDGMCTVKVEGDTGACKAAIAAGKRAAEMVAGTHQGTKSVLLKARPADAIIPKMIKHRENVGGDIALAEGYRPKGESRVPVLVSHWKPKEEPKEADAPIEKAPEPPVVEDLKEEPSETVKEPEVVEETPVSEAPAEQAPVEEVPVEEAPVEEAPVEEAPAEPAPAEEVKAEEAPAEPETVEAPVAEDAAAVEAPEPAPVEEVPAEPVVEAEPKAEEPEEAPAPAKAEKAEEAPKKKTTGTRRSGRSRKKKNSDKE